MIGAVMALYLNVFVSIVQAFLKVPVLHAAAPTHSEPPFQIVQPVALALFVAFAIAGVIRLRSLPSTASDQPSFRRRRPPLSA